MTSWITLLNKIEDFCLSHYQVEKFGGEFREQMPNFSTKDERYPVIWVEPTGTIDGLELTQFSVNIYCVDIIQKDRENINTILSDTHLILRDLYLYFHDGDDLSIDIISEPSMTPLNNLDLDYVAGWSMAVTFEVEGHSVCAIPIIKNEDDMGYQLTVVDITTSQLENMGTSPILLKAKPGDGKFYDAYGFIHVKFDGTSLGVGYPDITYGGETGKESIFLGFSDSFNGCLFGHFSFRRANTNQPDKRIISFDTKAFPMFDQGYSGWVAGNENVAEWQQLNEDLILTTFSNGDADFVDGVVSAKAFIYTKEYNFAL